MPYSHSRAVVLDKCPRRRSPTTKAIAVTQHDQVGVAFVSHGHCLSPTHLLLRADAARHERSVMDVKIARCPAGLAPVSLVLTVCNSAADLPDLLDSIARQQLLPSELLIVDLGSTDGTLEVLRSWRPPAGTWFRVIESPRVSIAQGRNLAIENASFDHIAVTHGAVRLHTEWLSRLWLALQDGAGLVSGDIRAAGHTLRERP